MLKKRAKNAVLRNFWNIFNKFCRLRSLLTFNIELLMTAKFF